MQQLSPSNGHSPPRLTQRLNRMLGEINVFLLALAIGLTVLDLTCYLALTVSDQLSRVQPGAEATMPPVAAARAPSIASPPQPPAAGFALR